MAIHRLLASQPFLPVFLVSNGIVIEAVGLIDTGASMTAVHPDTIELIQAGKIGEELVSRVGMPSRWLPTYYFNLKLGADEQEFGVEAVATEPASRYQLLIGRDLLSRWVLSWDGVGDQLLISY